MADWRLAVEIVGVITGLLSVYYAVKEDNRTWSIGIVNAFLIHRNETRINNRRTRCTENIFLVRC